MIKKAISGTQFCSIAFCVVVSALFFTDPIFVNPPAWLKHLLDLGHVVFFAVLSYIALSQLRFTKTYQQLLFALLLSFFLGGAIELTQALLNRYAEWIDLRKDVVGGLSGFLFYQWRNAALTQKRQWLAVLCWLPIVLESQSLALSLYDQYKIYQQAPMLADFENAYEIHRWQTSRPHSISTEHSIQGKHSLKILLSEERPSGVEYAEFYRDWSNYSEFQLSLYNPQKDKLAVTIKITDVEHDQGSQPYSDRFNYHIALKQGWNKITIPLSAISNAPKTRMLDLSTISRLQIFSGQLKQPRLLYIDAIQLLENTKEPTKKVSVSKKPIG